MPAKGICAPQEYSHDGEQILAKRESNGGASHGPFLRWFAQQIYEEPFRQPNELCLIITHLTFSTPQFCLFFHPHSAPPWPTYSSTKLTLTLLPRQGLFSTSIGLHIPLSAPLLAPIFSTPIEKAAQNCIFNNSQRQYLEIENEIIRWILPSGKGKTRAQNFCSSMTWPSLSTARQCVMLRASEEIVTPHFVSWRPLASYGMA